MGNLACTRTKDEIQKQAIVYHASARCDCAAKRPFHLISEGTRLSSNLLSRRDVTARQGATHAERNSARGSPKLYKPSWSKHAKLPVLSRIHDSKDILLNEVVTTGKVVTRHCQRWGSGKTAGRRFRTAWKVFKCNYKSQLHQQLHSITTVKKNNRKYRGSRA